MRSSEGEGAHIQVRAARGPAKGLMTTPDQNARDAFTYENEFLCCSMPNTPSTLFAIGRVFFLLFLCGIAFVAAGLTLTEGDEGRAIELEAGELFQIALEANPSAGFNWEPALFNESVIRMLDTAFIPDTAALGSSGKQLLRFKALASGYTLLRLIYRRSFEKNVPASKSFEIRSPPTIISHFAVVVGCSSAVAGWRGS